MLLFLLGGFAILGGLLLLGYLFVNADPARLVRGLRWAGIGVAVLAVAALAISGRLTLLLMPIAALLSLLGRIRSLVGGFRSPSAGRTSTAASAYLRMTLDHDSGTLTGTILRGRFAGLRLQELGLVELLALLRECRADDEDGARLLEAYLDRCRPNWRDGLAGERTGPRARSAGPDIGVDEAYAILGLAPGADGAAIKEAHHRLMKKLHPDHGGTDYLAKKINRARDVLLQQ
jgi:hypothetical protein